MAKLNGNYKKPDVIVSCRLKEIIKKIDSGSTQLVGDYIPYIYTQIKYIIGNGGGFMEPKKIEQVWPFAFYNKQIQKINYIPYIESFKNQSINIFLYYFKSEKNLDQFIFKQIFNKAIDKNLYNTVLYCLYNIKLDPNYVYKFYEKANYINFKIGELISFYMISYLKQIIRKKDHISYMLYSKKWILTETVKSIIDDYLSKKRLNW